MMRKLSSILFVVLFVFALALPAAAQENPMSEGMIVCDSTLITLLYVAEHDFGYEPMMDVSTFEKGQYAPLFDAMMMMEEGEMMEEMTPEAMMEGGDETMGEDMMMLTPGVVEGEPVECTDLRASLEGFFYDHFSMMMAEDM
jgi:hypothetical protein